jgi:hypothetical protein
MLKTSYGMYFPPGFYLRPCLEITNIFFFPVLAWLLKPSQNKWASERGTLKEQHAENSHIIDSGGLQIRNQAMGE